MQRFRNQNSAAWTRRRQVAVSLLLGVIVLATYAGFVHRYFLLCDDAFISFRYARNLVDGIGPVWNPGERVEGYTNPGWMLALATGIRLGVEPEVLAPLLGILAGGALLVLTAALGAGRRGWTNPWIWLAPGLLALNRSYAAWSSGGLETQLFSLLLLGGVACFVRERARCAERPWASAVLFGLAAVTRSDGGLLLIPAGVAYLLDLLARRRSPRSFARWLAPLLLIVGAHLAWRRSYYGSWLPNTFYAKVPGFWWDQGFYYLHQFFLDYHLYVLLPLVLLGLLLRRDILSALSAGILGLQLGYLAAIGGGFLEFRLLVPVLPYLYLALARGAGEVVEVMRRAGRESFLRLAAVPLVAVTLLAVTALGSASEQSRSWGRGIETLSRTRHFASSWIRQGKRLRDLIERGVLPSELRWQVRPAGALPYYTRWYTLDEFGLNDPSVSSWGAGTQGGLKPGHLRSAPLAYTRARRIQVLPVGPDLIRDVSFERIDRYRRELERRLQRRHLPEDEALIHCFEIEPGSYMIFQSTVSPGEIDSLFAGLRRCPTRASAGGSS